MATLLHKNTAYNQKIIDYYNECWVKRFEAGHNPQSLAIHMGYFEDGISDNEQAKLNMNRVLASMLNLRSDSQLHIVDAGCGVGGTCFYLAQNFPKLHITALNISSGQIEVAKQFYRKRNLQNSIHFLNEDYNSTSLPDSSVNCVYAIESICHAQDKRIFYNEAFRMLEPGGSLLILDYVMSENKKISGSQKALLETFREGWEVKEYITHPETDLKRAGFTSVKKEIITDHVLPGIRLSSARAAEKLSNGVAHIASAEMKKHWLACMALKELSAQGIIEYMILIATKRS